GSASISFQIWSISHCSSSTSSRPFLKELPVKMSPNRGARTTRKPYAWSAQTAHSREDPQPKFSPATRTVAAVKGRRLRTKSRLSRQSANSAASSPVLSTPEQNRTGMIWSVSTSAIFIGAATPVCSSNFSIVLVHQVARCDESARDRARCGDGGRDQMGLDAGALSPLEVAVVGRGGALAGRVLVLVQSHAQRAPRVPQTHAGGLEHTVQALLDRLSADPLRAWHQDHVDPLCHAPALEDARRGAEILDASVGAGPDEHRVDLDVRHARPRLELHVLQRTLGGGALGGVGELLGVRDPGRQ